MSPRCGYPIPTVIPVCRRVETMWSINRAILTPDPDPDSDDAKIKLPIFSICFSHSTPDTPI